VAGVVAGGVARLARRPRHEVRAAAVAAAAAGAGQELPASAAVAPLGARAVRGSPVAAAFGTAVAVATRRLWPVAPTDGAELRPRRIPDPEQRPSPRGAGVRIVVNPDAGPNLATSAASLVGEALPDAEVIERGPDDDVAELLRAGASDDVVAVGAAGGDGTLNAAAHAAVELDVPLVAVPAGTLNHLARDLGLASVDDAVEAVQAGTVAHIDLGCAGDRLFLNTASLGGYTEVVDAREALEQRIGKWPALVLALARVLHRQQPIAVEIDGAPRSVWLVFIGNCAYSPPGFGPSWRRSLDDGLLDVRLVDGTQPWARTRLVLAVLTGTLARCAVYEERRVASLDVRGLDGDLRVALDGETIDAGEHVAFGKRRRALAVAVPP
jgi:undecaprenyl-diphosphatase